MNQSSTFSTITFPKSIPLDIDTESYLEFLEKSCSSPSLQWIVLSFPYECKDPLQWFDVTKKQSAFNFYWQNPDSLQAIAAVGSILNIKSEGTQRFNDVRQLVTALQDKALHINITAGHEINDIQLVGGFSFFDDMQYASSWNGFDSASFRLPEFALKHEKEQTMASIAIALDKNRTPEHLHQRISTKIAAFFKAGHTNGHQLQNASNSEKKQQGIPNKKRNYNKWIKLICGAKQAINNKSLNKVVLGRQLQLDVQQKYDAIATVQNLRSQYPKCTTFLIKNEDSGTFMGCSPEQLLSVKDKKIKTEALAGSIARGSTKKQDDEWASDLMNSFKDHEEHTYVVNDIKQLLEPFVKSIGSTPKPVIKKLANVQHLYSPIQGNLKNNEQAISILGALHPTPAVGGTPRDNALQYIQDHEPFNRGWFASPVGWITTGGEAEFTVAIRSGLISEKSALLFAGCGIVADSDPETEWKETNLKFMPMLSALNYD